LRRTGLQDSTHDSMIHPIQLFGIRFKEGVMVLWLQLLQK
jgi:hypothetical protein